MPLLALDFDGVICDGRPEYFQTAWRVFRQIWAVTDPEPPAEWQQRFFALRPLVEVGWEMPLVLRAFQMGLPDQQLWRDWATTVTQILAQDSLVSAEVAEVLDRTRDRWIKEDLPDWLGQHRMYPGVMAQITHWIDHQETLYIVTTKESRFVAQLLAQHQVVLPPDHLIGKEAGRPKSQTLLQLLDQTQQPIWFVEDRLKTLEGIRQVPALEGLELFLADWGYNTPEERQSAQDYPRIQLLSLPQFTDPAWLRKE